MDTYTEHSEYASQLGVFTATNQPKVCEAGVEIHTKEARVSGRVEKQPDFYVHKYRNADIDGKKEGGCDCCGFGQSPGCQQ